MTESNVSTSLPSNTKPAPVATSQPAASSPAPAPAPVTGNQPSVSPKNSRRQMRKQH